MTLMDEMLKEKTNSEEYPIIIYSEIIKNCRFKERGNMGAFLESEKPFQAIFKEESNTISNNAKRDGVYKGKSRPFCLPVDNSVENLFPAIRKTAIEHFAKLHIKWHDGQNGNPSNHLCDSQVCCVNFLFPFADKPGTLATLLEPIFPEIDHMLPIEEGRFVSFEWIGAKNYLGERISRNGTRTRGANFTSADAIVLFECKDKKKQAVLIEWKYTESYGGNSLKVSDSGTDRTRIYRHLFERIDCPINKELLLDFDALFYEPFYQFMRQQFLAHEMEVAHELKADIVTLLHIAPEHNLDFKKITSPTLNSLGNTATEVWKKLVREKGRFISVSTESLFESLLKKEIPELLDWKAYITSRYRWVR